MQRRRGKWYHGLDTCIVLKNKKVNVTTYHNNNLCRYFKINIKNIVKKYHFKMLYKCQTNWTVDGRTSAVKWTNQ